MSPSTAFQTYSQAPSHYRAVSRALLGLAHRSSLPIHTVAEVDITRLLELKRRHGFGLSAILIKTIADTLMSTPDFRPLNSILSRRLTGDRLVSWDTVSVSVALDRTFAGERVAAAYEIPNVDRRPLEDIDAELRRVHEMPIEALPIHGRLKRLQWLPVPMCRAAVRLLAAVAGIDRLSPASIGFTNFGPGAMRAVFPVSPRTLMFGVGGRTRRVVEVAPGRFETRPFLTLTTSFNHFAVDGMLCNAFVTALVARLEAL